MKLKDLLPLIKDEEQITLCIKPFDYNDTIPSGPLVLPGTLPCVLTIPVLNVEEILNPVLLRREIRTLNVTSPNNNSPMLCVSI